ncbi:MAG TPA: type II secretion system protein GspJ, partial [Verrucomicrobiae bacterium]|nr:type II secretion system protein GspJ [Verrucomicrobiae bacterium]
MILAVAVAAIVLAAINAAFFTALHLRDATDAAVDAATPVDQALSVMRRDLQCMVTPNGVLSGDLRVGNVTSFGIDEPVAIEMYTATGALSSNPDVPWGDIQRVTYELKTPTDRSQPGRELIRSVTRNLLTVATPDVKDQLMLTGVQNVTVSCYDGSQWLDTWDTTDLSSANTNLPAAVRMEIQMAGRGGNGQGQTIELLVPIDSQARTNMTFTASQ